jgi:hypothetical protein
MPLFLPDKARMASGQREHTVTIQQRVVGPGRFPTESWTTLVVLQMSRQDMRLDERYTSDQVSAYVETTWQGPYRADMDPDLVNVARDRRLLVGTRIYNIRAASVMERRTGIEFLTLAASA